MPRALIIIGILLLSPGCFKTDAASSGDVQELNESVEDAAKQIDELEQDIEDLNDILCALADDCPGAPMGGV